MGQLADKTGVNIATISLLERKAGRDARISTLVKLAQFLEVSVDFLTCAEDPDLDFHVALRRQALRRFLSSASLDDLQRNHFEQLCFKDSAPISVRGWLELAENLAFLQAQRALDGPA